MIGTFRRVERVQPGWLLACGEPDDTKHDGVDVWCEVRCILQGGPVFSIEFTDGTRARQFAGDEVRCITNAEKRLRREVLGGAS